MNEIYAMPVGDHHGKGSGKANPTKYAERGFLPEDVFFNDAIVVEVWNKRTDKVGFRIVAGGLGNEQVGDAIKWVTDSGLGLTRAGYHLSFHIRAIIKDNVIVAGAAPSKSLPLYVFK